MTATYKAFEVDLPVINDKTFNIADLGAVSGGKVPCTEALLLAARCPEVSETYLLKTVLLLIQMWG